MTFFDYEKKKISFHFEGQADSLAFAVAKFPRQAVSACRPLKPLWLAVLKASTIVLVMRTDSKQTGIEGVLIPSHGLQQIGFRMLGIHQNIPCLRHKYAWNL